MKERRVYTAEFKREAVRLSEQADVSVAQVAQELGLSDYSLYKWRKQAKAGGELAFPGNGKVALTAEQQENVRLKKELERVTQERDVLKKAVKFFAGESK
jgi:transposase